MTGLAAERRELLSSDDVANDERVHPEFRARLSANAYQSLACIPVVHGRQLLGSFNLAYPRGTSLGLTERDMLVALANSLGVAMAQRIAVERERELERQARRAQQLESLGVLASGIAHDFNNLLMGIVGNIEIARFLAEDAGIERIVDTLGEALSASDRAERLIKQLLTFSRGGAPAFAVTHELGPLVREVAPFAARGTSVCCDVEIEEPLGAVEIDAGQIAQVVQNLVLNACQASPSGSVVRVRVRRVEGERPRVFVEVHDEGRGIAPEHLGRIFEPFFTARPGGTGLGLAVSHSIVHRHGGELLVESEPGQGTTFTITLPISEAAAEPSAVAGPELQQFGGWALVMDDDPQVRIIAVQLLRRLGFEVDSAPDGTEALARARAAVAEGRPYRVALLDLTVVGGLGGADIADELREVVPDIRLIVSSGYDDRGHQGWDGRLHKPYQLLALSRALTTVLGR